MLKDIILSALVSTPLGLAMVAGIGWLIRYGWRALRAAVRERSRRTEDYPSTASRSPSPKTASRCQGRFGRETRDDGRETMGRRAESARPTETRE